MEGMEKCKIIPFPLDRRFASLGAKAYTLRVYLVRGPYGGPAEGREIYRTIKVRSDQTLEDLHYAIFCSYERIQDEEYEFSLGLGRRPGGFGPGIAAGSLGDPEGPVLPPQVTLGSLDLEEDQVFRYRFDPVEEWVHLIHVLSIEKAASSEEYPMLLERVGFAPLPELDSTSIDAWTDHGTAPPETPPEENFLALLVDELQARWRRQAEDLPLRPRTRLRTALGKLPTHWLQAIGTETGIAGLTSRKECLELLSARLPRPEVLRAIWDELPLPSREMLRWILEERGGWASIHHLSQRYGPDPDRTWWWSEGQLPETPLGILRSRGLVFVGRNRQENRRIRIAAVPVELREGLRGILRDRPGTGTADRAAAGPSRGTRADSPGPSNPWKGLDALNLRAFLEVCPLREDTQGIYTRTLGRIRRRPESFPKRHVRELLSRMVRGRSAWGRLAAYKVALALLDRRFVASALTDPSRMIQQWAREALETPQESLF